MHVHFQTTFFALFTDTGDKPDSRCSVIETSEWRTVPR